MTKGADRKSRKQDRNLNDADPSELEVIEENVQEGNR